MNEEELINCVKDREEVIKIAQDFKVQLDIRNKVIEGYKRIVKNFKSQLDDAKEAMGYAKHYIEKNALTHKGYSGSVLFSADDRILHGRVLDIVDIVSFEGSSVSELEKSFQKAVEDYIKTIKSL